MKSLTLVTTGGNSMVDFSTLYFYVFPINNCSNFKQEKLPSEFQQIINRDFVHTPLSFI